MGNWRLGRLRGRYCPTTCGVAEHLFKYTPGVYENLDYMLGELERIGNLTRGAEATVVHMRDSTTSPQKTSQPGKIEIMPLV
ncbi:Fibrinogen gamma chain [Merluccius polli]|uniref:Fibrinogen gamma chain n=1 Tax=Merluccius polli TaxID=89951 RepID=A0AA47M5Y6_MERPO|nr:Fibrinogen gamma chain [Merluccius polli]